MVQRVIIIGGGLAGLAAATALAPRGFAVTILESRNRLGGRAGSFEDARTGELIDACQHATMGCCTNFLHFCRTVGMDRLLATQRRLYFMTPDGRVSPFGGGPFPAPFHLGRSFLGAHFLTPAEKLRIGYGLACLKWAAPDADPPLEQWLLNHFQTPRTIARFWGLILVSALNETPDRLGLRYARKVLLEGFVNHPQGFEVSIPTAPLGRLYGEELRGWLQRFNVDLRLQQGVKRILVEDDRVTGLEGRQGEIIQADYYVAALPFDRLPGLLPENVVAEREYFGNLKELETSPITSVHCWFDRPLTPLPHVVLIDCLGQWLFNRGVNAAGEHYAQVVISAARALRGLGHDEIQRRVVAELRALFPAARDAKLIRTRVVTEHAATFSAVPGVDRWRPTQASPLGNLFVAGDWTRTGWPATMEGAVRSGYLAAEALLRSLGKEATLVQPDL